MSVEKVEKILESKGFKNRIFVFEEGTETSQKAAEQIGCQVENIAKSMAFDLGDRAILVVSSGRSRIDNRKFKDKFGKKAKMVSKDDLVEKIGYPMGGVCPFGVKDGVEVYFDQSLKKLDAVYPAAGDEASIVKLKLEEFEDLAQPVEWVDVTKEG